MNLLSDMKELKGEGGCFSVKCRSPPLEVFDKATIRVTKEFLRVLRACPDPFDASRDTESDTVLQVSFDQITQMAVAGRFLSLRVDIDQHVVHLFKLPHSASSASISHLVSMHSEWKASRPFQNGIPTNLLLGERPGGPDSSGSGKSPLARSQSGATRNVAHAWDRLSLEDEKNEAAAAALAAQAADGPGSGPSSVHGWSSPTDWSGPGSTNSPRGQSVVAYSGNGEGASPWADMALPASAANHVSLSRASSLVRTASALNSPRSGPPSSRTPPPALTGAPGSVAAPWGAAASSATSAAAGGGPIGEEAFGTAWGGEAHEAGGAPPALPPKPPASSASAFGAPQPLTPAVGDVESHQLLSFD